MKTKYLLSFIYISLLIVIVVVLYKIRPDNRPSQAISPSPTITPVATPTGFMTLASPKIEKKEVYKIAMVGDSMTAALGPHGGGMSEYINDLYKESDDNQQAIIIDNYAVSSNLLSVDKQISEKLTVSEYTFGPLLATDYDLILIESFGYNPLSEFGVDEGIKKQNEALDTLMEKLIKEKPKWP